MRYLSPPTAKVFPSFILSFFSNEKYTGISLQKVEGEVIVSLSDCKVVPAQNGGKSYCYVDTKYTDDANKDRYCKGYMEMDGVDLVYPGDPLHDDPDSEYYYFSMNYTLRPGHTVKTTKVRLWELK